MRVLLLAVTSIALSVAAQFLLKAGVTKAGQSSDVQAGRVVAAYALQPEVLLGFLLYGLGAVVWLAVLARWDVSKAYPLVGLGFAATVVVGLLVGEQVTVLRAGGVLLICAGVALVAAS